MKNKVDETPSTLGWYFSTSVPFKTTTEQRQDRFPLTHMEKNYMGSSQEGKVSSISCWLYDTSFAEET